MTETRRWTFLTAVLLLLAVAALSLLPTQDKFALHTQGRLHPWLHVLAFAVLTFLLLRAVRSPGWRLLVVTGMVAFGYGTEFAEQLLDTWPVEQTDVLLDGAGVLLGAAVGGLWPAGSQKRGRGDRPRHKEPRGVDFPRPAA